MVADASIYGNIKPTQPLEGPLDQFAKVANLRALMDQSRLHGLQTQQLEQSMGEDQATREVFRNAPVGATLESLVPDVLRASPKAGIDLQGKVIKNKQESAALDKTTLEISAAKAKDARDGLAGVTDQASYDAWRQDATQKGYQVAKAAPPAFDQTWQQQHLMTADKFIEQLDKQKQRDVTIRGQDLSAKSAAEGHALTKRGQDLTDSRQRELNGIFEGQTAEPSAALVKSIATGEIELKPPPTNARNPVMLQRYGQMLEKVKAENPNWSQEMYPTIKKTVAAFAAGKEGQTVKALNTATDHLETLRELVAAQKNGNVQLFNRIANQYAANTGNAAPSNLAVAAQVIGGEIVKGIVGAGGGVGERERAEAAFSNVKSPADAEGALNTVTKLMGGQFKGMQKQYEAGTYGRKDFGEKYLTPAAQKALAAAQAPHQEAPGSQAAGKPAKGAVQDGYRFKGGDPAKQENWEKV